MSGYLVIYKVLDKIHLGDPCCVHVAHKKVGRGRYIHIHISTDIVTRMST